MPRKAEMSRFLTYRRAFALGVLVLALSGCGGGGGGDEGGGGNQPTTFTVGGTVTGLTGGNIVLRLNGANDLTVNASGSFTFSSAALANGASYTVTILGQPASPSTQVCGPGVGNGTGTISAGNVTNVTINCANYTVGGTVTGLAASGLVLQLNEGNDLSVDALAATFTFPSSTSLGGNILYGVHIKTQPAGQTCTVVDSTGVVAAAAPNVTTAKVECVDNMTDPLSGTYVLTSDTEEPVDSRGFLTFYPDGTFIFGIHGDHPIDECGATRGNGVQYGIYSWDEDSHAFRIRRMALDTVTSMVNGEAVTCGIDSDTEGALISHADGSLSFIDDEGAAVFTPVRSTSGELIGSWGDNQAFIVYDSDGKFFLVSTRAVVQNTASSPGIEDGCYTLSGSTAAGSYTVNLSGSCTTSGTLAAVDTNGPIALSQLVGATLNFTVTGDSLQLTLGGASALRIVPGTRIVTVTPPPSTFGVGGSITNLTGTGLTLRLNGQVAGEFNTSPAGGAGSFEFTAQLQAGAAYAVTIVAQPASPTQLCFFTGGRTGMIAASHVADVAINCLNSSSYTISGSVTGLTANLALGVHYFQANGAVVVANLDVAADGQFTFPLDTIPANSPFSLGILTQPAGQTCTIVRAAGFSLGPPVANIAVACTNSATDPLSGTYSALIDSGLRRSYVNFNADGTFTTAMIHDDSECGADADPLNDGNGVEYGIFTWNQATGAFQPPVKAAVDTNGSCGLSHPDLGRDGFQGFITRVGNTIELRESPGDPVPLVTATAVESTPGSLVGAFAPEANNGILLVFHADGTFLWAETQRLGLPPSRYGQERGCYSISDSSVELTMGPGCLPDGFPAYDLNGFGGVFPNGATPVGPIPFTFSDPDTLTIFGRVFKRTAPN